jgi:hypothetical protein
MVTEGNYTFRIYNDTETIYNESLYVNETKGIVIYTNNTRTIVNVIERSTNGTLQRILEISWEEYNLSDPNIQQLIGLDIDINNTANELNEEFRKTHVLDIPQLSERYTDTEPPQSTIAAIMTFEGDLHITWNSVDESGEFAEETDISYRKENTTQWKVWVNGTSPYGSMTFNNEIEQLNEGETYYFRALARDNAGNAEEQNTINVVAIVYDPVTYGESYTAEDLMREASQQWIFILAIIAIILIFCVVVFIDRKKDNLEKKMAAKTSNSYQEEEDDVL